MGEIFIVRFLQLITVKCDVKINKVRNEEFLERTEVESIEEQLREQRLC